MRPLMEHELMMAGAIVMLAGPVVVIWLSQFFGKRGGDGHGA